MIPTPMDRELLTDWLRLVRTPGIGSATLGHLIRHLGSPAAVLSATRKLLSTVPHLRPGVFDTLEQFRRSTPTAPVTQELDRLHGMGGRTLILGAPDYPPLLAAIHDPPPVLFVLGNPEALQGGGPITVTGSRKATKAGLEFAAQLGRDLAHNGLVTVTSLSIGIDTSAHRAALEAEGATVAVLVNGLDISYPMVNRDLQRLIPRQGCLVTESPLGVAPLPWLFGPRSRILSGISRGVVIVEAATPSGALMTARMALEQGREVFAVPGQPNDPLTKGTHNLLRQGARLTEGIADVLEELAWPMRPPLEPSIPDPALTDPNRLCGKDPASILARIQDGPIQEDDLARCCQLTVTALSRILLQLELSGLVERVAGGRYTSSTHQVPPPAERPSFTSNA